MGSSAYARARESIMRICRAEADVRRLRLEALADAGFTDIKVTADYRDDRRPGPGSRVWTFHAIRPR